MVCDDWHMQLYTGGAICSSCIGTPRRAVMCLDDPHALSPLPHFCRIAEPPSRHPLIGSRMPRTPRIPGNKASLRGWEI